MPIWPGVVPDAQAAEGPEESGTVVDRDGNKKLVAGRPWVYVGRVSQPTKCPPVCSSYTVGIQLFRLA
jgi:hypothetical protein